MSCTDQGYLLTAQLGTPARTDAWVKANCTRLSKTSNLAKGATIVANRLRDVLGSRSSQRNTQHAAAHTAGEKETRETRLLRSSGLIGTCTSTPGATRNPDRDRIRLQIRRQRARGARHNIGALFQRPVLRFNARHVRPAAPDRGCGPPAFPPPIALVPGAKQADWQGPLCSRIVGANLVAPGSSR